MRAAEHQGEALVAEAPAQRVTPETSGGWLSGLEGPRPGAAESLRPRERSQEYRGWEGLCYRRPSPPLMGCIHHTSGQVHSRPS